MNFNLWTGKPQNQHRRQIKPGLTTRIWNQSVIGVGPVETLRRIVCVRSDLLADVLGPCHEYLFSKGFRFDGKVRDAAGADNFYFSRELL